MIQLRPSQLLGVVKNGPTDPIEYYHRPLIGRLFCRRINLGLGLLPDRTYPRALEVGFGAGGLLLVLDGHVRELHGIDLDADPVAVTRMLADRGCRADVRQGSVYEMPYATGTFDLVVCFSVFEHLDGYQRALREVQRVLAPGGLFLLGMPAVNRLMGHLFQCIGYNTIDDHHVTTPAMAEQAFAAAGFTLRGFAPLDFPAPRPFGFRLYHNWLLEKHP